jgi:hypothetical protein
LVEASALVESVFASAVSRDGVSEATMQQGVVNNDDAKVCERRQVTTMKMSDDDDDDAR